jgi:hypothetical protein
MSSIEIKSFFKKPISFGLYENNIVLAIPKTRRGFLFNQGVINNDYNKIFNNILTTLRFLEELHIAVDK